MGDKVWSRRGVAVLAAVLVVWVVVPVGAAANPSATCVSEGRAPGDPGTIVERDRNTLVVTGTDAADRVEVGRLNGAVTVLTSFAGSYTFGGEFFMDVEVYGCRGGDSIVIGSSPFSFLYAYGDEGRDRLDSRAADDRDNFINLFGGSGNDELLAGDVVGDMALHGGPGNDVIEAGRGGTSGNAAADGGSGNDTIRVGDVQLERWIVRGGSGNDVIEAGDSLALEGYNLDGGPGNDTITMGVAGPYGSPVDIVGGLGRDTISVSAVRVEGTGVLLTGGEGRDQLTIGDLTVFSDGFVRLSGNEGGDTLTVGDNLLDAASTGPIELDGGPQKDTCATGSGVFIVISCER